MTTTSTDPRSRVLDAAKDAVAARMRAEADLLEAAAQWALLHPVTEAVDAAGWCFGEDLVPLAGAGGAAGGRVLAGRAGRGAGVADRDRPGPDGRSPGAVQP